MNKAYRLIWNEFTGSWIPVAENVRGRGKRASRPLCSAVLTTLIALLPASVMAQTPVANQLPTGGNVVAGTVAITQNNAVMAINQSTARAAIDWQTFNVGSAAQVNFIQPSSSSVTLNRVLDSNPSQIHGRITANGQVFLTNPNGVYFSPTARVDVGGLVATTHSIDNADFMAGDNRFARNGATGSVVNEGELNASLEGYIALLAPEVRNRGVIVAQLGTVALAAGEAYTLQFDGNNTLAALEVEPTALATLVDNGNAVHAPGGQIILSAKAVSQLQGGVVNSSGTLAATGISSRGGRIMLDAGNGFATVDGTLDVSSDTAKGGDIKVTGKAIQLEGSAVLDATGATGGGLIQIGGSWQNSDPSVPQAVTTTIDTGALIDASAINEGNGGEVVVWSDITNPDSVTTVDGTIFAKAGLQGGDGGNIETSGYRLNYDKATINASSQTGTGGLWLIDPDTAYNVINQTNANVIAASLNSGTSVTNLVTSGDIVVNNNVSVSKTSGGNATLTFKTPNTILMGSGSSIKSTSGALNIVLWSSSNNAGGRIQLDNGVQLLSNGGDIIVGGGSGGTTSPTGPADGASSFTGFYLGASAIISASGGNISIKGKSSGNLKNGIHQWGTVQTSGTGTIYYEGVNTGLDNESAGIWLQNALIQSQNGEIKLYANGSKHTGGKDLILDGAATIQTTGSGNIFVDVTLNTPDIWNDISFIDFNNSSTRMRSLGGGDITLVGMEEIELAGQIQTTGVFTLRPDAEISTSDITSIEIGNGSDGDNAKLTFPISYFTNNLVGNFEKIIIDASNLSINITGALSVSSPLELDAKSITMSGDITTNSNNLKLSSSETSAIGKQLSLGAGNLELVGNFVLTAQQRNYTGDSYIWGGTVTQLTNNAFPTATALTMGLNSTFDINGLPINLGSLNSTNSNQSIVDAYTIAVGVNNESTFYGGTISSINDLASLTKRGSGTFTLSGNNSLFSGRIDVENGTLVADNNIALGNSTNGTTVASGATLDVRANVGAEPVALDAGTLSTSTGSGSLSGPVTLGANSTISVGGAHLTLSGVIDDGPSTYGITKTGTGLLLLSGANTYNGATTVSAGKLQVGGGSTTGTLGTGNVTNNASLVFNRSNALTVSNAISGSGSVTQLGSGTTTLTGNNSYSGGTLLFAGTLALDSANAIGSSGAILFGGGTLQYSAANTSDYSSRFSNVASQAYKINTNGQNVALASALTSSGGTFGKSGSGTLTLSGNNNYSGTTTVSGGTLQIGAGGASGTLGSGDVSINVAALSFNRSGTWTVANNISSSGSGSVSKNGSSTLTLSGNNSYSGTTTINNGTLVVTSNTALGATSGPTSINSGGTLDLKNVAIGNEIINISGTGTLSTSSGTSSLSGGVLPDATYSTINVGSGAQLALAGKVGCDGTCISRGIDKTGAGTLILTNDTNNYVETKISAGTLQVGSGSTTGVLGSGNVTNNGSLVINRSNALSVNNVISGTGTLTKQGNGILTLNGVNTYTGATTISSGTLRLGTSNRLSDTTAVSVSSGATFDLTNYSDTVGSIAGAGNITLGSGTLIAGGNNSSTTFTGIISETGNFTKAGSGILTLSGINTYTGATTISSGTLRLGTSNRLSDTTAVSVSSGATFDLTNYSDAVGSISGAGNITLGSGTLTTGASNTSTVFSGVISETGNLVKTGSGTFTLSGNNTYTGSTTINNGTISLGKTNALPTNTALSMTGGDGDLRLDLTSNYDQTIGSLEGSGRIYLYGRTLTTGGNNTNTNFSGVMSGGTGGSLVKNGSGIFTLSGANSYTGTTTISAGTLEVTHANGLGSTTNGTTVANGASLKLSNALVGAETLSLNGTGVGAAGALINSGTSSLSGLVTVNTSAKVGGTGSLTLGNITVLDGQTLTLGGGSSLSVATGSISGVAGGTASNLTVNAGTTNLGAIGTDMSTVSISGTALTLGSINANSLSMVVGTSLSQSGAVVVSGQTNLTSSSSIDLALADASNDFGGGVRVVSGRNVTLNDISALVLGNGTSTISGNLNVTANGAITQGGALAVTGTSDFAAGSGNDITLSTTSNNFGGGVRVVSGRNVSIVDANAMTLGNAGGGVNISGTLTAETLTGDLMLTQNIVTTDTSTAAVLLNAGKSTAAGTAAGGNLLISGTPTITTGDGGRTTLMTGSVAGSTGLTDLVGSGSGRFRYSSDEATTTYTEALGSGNHAIYREQALVTVVANGDSKIYDKVAYFGNTGYSVPTGLLNGDTTDILIGSMSIGGDSQGAVNAGNYDLTPSGLSNTLGYGFNYVNGTLTIAQKTVTPDTTNVGKVYDGTNLMTRFAVAGVLAGDDVALAGSGTFGSAHAGNNLNYYFQGNSSPAAELIGASASNYLISWQGYSDHYFSGVNAQITPRALTATAAINAASKTYDGLLAATMSTVIGDLAGEVGTDSFSLDTSALSLSFSDAHVATASKTISASGNVALGTLSSSGSGDLSGSSTSNLVVSAASDYVLNAQPIIAAVAGTINAKALTASTLIAGAAKTYDGLLAATGSSVSGSTSGAINGDTVALDTSGISLNFDNAHAGSRNVVASGNAVLGALVGVGVGSKDGTTGNAVAGQAGDYVLSAQPTTSSVAATINARSLTAVAGITAVDKTYDGLLAATDSSVAGSTSGAINGDTVALDTSGISLNFDNAHAGSRNVVASGNTLLGAVTGGGSGSKDGTTGNAVQGQAGDYVLSAQPTISSVVANINARALTAVASITAVDKTYDKLLAATGSSVSGSTIGAINGDTVALDTSGISLNFDNAHAGSRNVVAGGNVALGTLVGGGLGSKDGTTGNAVAGQAGDYVLSAQPTINSAAATINTKLLTAIAGIAAAPKTYDGLLAATGSTVTGSIIGLVGSDSMALDTSGATLVFDSAHAGSHLVAATGSVSYGTLVSAGRGAMDGNGVGNEVASSLSDYSFAALPTLTAVTSDITPRALSATASIAAVDKTYDGFLVAMGSSVSGSTSGVINGDAVALDTSGISLNFDNAHAGSRNVVASGNAALGAVTGGGSGTKDGTAGNAVAGQAGDYLLSAQPTISAVAATITPLGLSATASMTAVDKIYDGLLAAIGSSVSGSTIGAINGDTVALDTSGISLNFDNAHAGNRNVAASGNAALGVVTGGGNGSKDGTAGNAVAGQAGDYVLSAQPTISSMGAAINPAQLLVKANDDIRVVSAMPYAGGNGVSYAGFVNGETSEVLGGVLFYTGSSQGAVAGGNYVITPQGLTSTDYGLAFASGDLTIAEAYVPAPFTPVLSLPLMGEVVALAISPSPSSGQSTSSQNGVGLVTADGVSISLIKAPSELETVVVTVSVPKGMATSGTGFGFPLPTDIVEMLSEVRPENVTVSLLDGQPLPGWLSYMRVLMKFEATSVPDGGLPVQVLLSFGGRRVMVVVSERTE